MTKPVTLSGLDWKAFLDEKSIWTGESWVEDEVILLDGKETENWERCPDTALVKVIQGTIRYSLDKGDDADLVSTLKSWLHARQRVILLVETTKEWEDSSRFRLKAADLKVLN